MRGRPYYPYTVVIMIYVRRQDDRLLVIHICTVFLHMCTSYTPP